jgi:molybdopterin-containing oxidoreductase family iron-sulfur binding subunit
MNDDEQGRRAQARAEKSDSGSYRSLSELEGMPAHRAAKEGEFPPGADEPHGIGRRDLIKLLGASMTLAGVGCARDRTEKIMPYTVPPRGMRPGIPNYYATSMPLDGFATGLLVESHEGRPTKIEGNPAHPASLGATGVYEQASILGLYDPDRARGLRFAGGEATWDRFLHVFAGERRDGGDRLRFLLEPTGSPLIEELFGVIGQRFPGARFTFSSAVRSGYALEGARTAFGEPLQPQYDFSKATVIVSLDADFLATMPFSVRYARQFAERRRIGAPNASMNRLYVVESMLSPTGSVADHRLRKRPSEIARVSASIAAELLLGLGVAPKKPMLSGLLAALAPLRAKEDASFIQALARDLSRNAGSSLVIAGDRQPPIVHVVAHLINALLGNAEAAWATAPILLTGGPAAADLDSLVDELRRGQVDTLVMLEGNPAYTAPADIAFADLLARVPNTVYLGLYEDETARASQWFMPAAHYLEAWGDARAYDGTISLLQPLIAPLFGGRTPSEILSTFTGESYPDAHRLLRSSWSRRYGGDDFERFWQETLRAGLVPGSEAKAVAPTLRFDAITAAIAAFTSAPRPEGASLEVAFLPDARVYDGRFANNAWLLELPDPTTKLTWDNAAMLSPGTAANLGVKSEDILLIEVAGRKVEMPALIVPGHADGAISLPLGYGREGVEALARGVGVNVYRLRTRAAPVFATSVAAQKAPGHHPLALTQTHWSLEGRPVAPSTTLAAFRKNPDFTVPQRGPVPSLYTASPSSGDQWAMTIDMSICTGCSSCVVACQAENNIPIVGKEGVMQSREMHWLRIDTYYSGDPAAPEVVHQPMLCQHCEKAPCEYPCPVNATVHSPDGLNEMVYNRCVGTRFCSNNCPYKVRRFNWFDWNEREPRNEGLVKLQRNPDVTVRERGVMEKCTYCVQRIRGTEIKAQLERRPIRQGEVMTACQQACPTGAIQFDSLANQASKMVKWRNEPRSYEVLHELGTVPRTRYLVNIKNPNPEIE